MAFIAHTGRGEPSIRRVAAQMGFQDLIVKGQPLSALLDVLLQVPEERFDV